MLPRLRAETIKLLKDDPSVLGVYRTISWDADGLELPDNVRRLGSVGTSLLLLGQQASSVELSEPLYIREFPRTVLYAACARGGARRVGQRVRIGTYAIENLGPGERLGLGSLLSSLGTWLIGTLARRLFDVIVFGSPGARDNYVNNHLAESRKAILHVELPSLHPDADGAGRRSGVLFAGELSERKGLPELVSAWESIENHVKGHALHIAGDGPLSETIEAWCRQDALSRVFMGRLPQHEVAAAMRAVKVVVAPSQRVRRWREQIGLAIKEGLASGCWIVTTDETGLAEWLTTTGHFVVPATAPELIGPSLLSALSESGPVPTGALPAEEGRMVASRLIREG